VICDEWKLARLELLAGARKASGSASKGAAGCPGDRPAPPGRPALLGDYPAIGLADAMNVVLAREFRTDVIATLDRRHFRVIRPLTRHDAFRFLPDDRRRSAS
jgi:hypothetical protein